ncbi:5179_t:CDS:2, partial [Diversispora eburnea]
KLGLHRMRERAWNVHPSCATTGEVFLKALGNDKILSLKEELVRILDDKGNGDPTKIRLLKADNNNPPVYTSLDREGETVNSYGLSDEQILYLSYWDDKIGDTYHQQVKVVDNISMEEDDNISMEEDGKGKARA